MQGKISILRNEKDLFCIQSTLLHLPIVNISSPKLNQGNSSLFSDLLCGSLHTQSLFPAGFALVCKQGSLSQLKYLQPKILSSLVFSPVLEYLSFLSVEKTLHDLTLAAHPVGGVACFPPTPSRHWVTQHCHKLAPSYGKLSGDSV